MQLTIFAVIFPIVIYILLYIMKQGLHALFYKTLLLFIPDSKDFISFTPSKVKYSLVIIILATLQKSL
jgi:hypothetical protein